MSCEFNSMLRNLCDKTFSHKFINKFFNNSLWTSILIVIIILLITILIFPIKNGTSLWFLFKFIIYSFIFTFGILIIHDGVLRFIYEKRKSDMETNDMIEEVIGNNQISDYSDSSIQIPLNDDYELTNIIE